MDQYVLLQGCLFIKGLVILLFVEIIYFLCASIYKAINKNKEFTQYRWIFRWVSIALTIAWAISVFWFNYFEPLKYLAIITDFVALGIRN